MPGLPTGIPKSSLGQPNGPAQLDANGNLLGTVISRVLTTTQLAAIVPDDGEFVWTSDTNLLYVGDGVTTGGIPTGNIYSDRAVIVNTLDSATTNAAAARAAYTAAKALTPGGSALSATNRAVVLLSPGNYDFGVGDGTNHGWQIDNAYVDVVGLSSDPKHVRLTSQINTASRGTVEHTAVCLIANVTIHLNDTGAGPGGVGIPYYTTGGNTLLDNVNLERDSGLAKMTQGVTYSGSYRRVTGESIFYGVTECSGTFIECGRYSSAATDVAFWGVGTLSGVFIRCSGPPAGTPIDQTFQGTTISGTFIDCHAGYSSFAATTITSAARFYNCSGLAGSFSATSNSGAFVGCAIDGVPFNTGQSLVPFTPTQGSPPTTNFATLDTLGTRYVLDFDQTTDGTIYFTGVLPASYGGRGLSVIVYWAPAATQLNGAVKWGVAFERLIATPLSGDYFDTSHVTETAGPFTQDVPVSTTIPFTNDQIAALLAGEPFRIKVTRLNATTGTNLTANAQLYLIDIQEAV